MCGALLGYEEFPAEKTAVQLLSGTPGGPTAQESDSRPRRGLPWVYSRCIFVERDKWVVITFSMLESSGGLCSATRK